MRPQLTTPQSLESEQATLGACLMDADAVAIAAELLGVEDFYRELHKHIFGQLLVIFDQGGTPDFITVGERLRSIGKLEECGGVDYLVSLIDACPGSANVRAYADTVKEKSVMRQLSNASDQIKNWAMSEDPAPAGEILARAEAQILSIGERKNGDGFTLASQGLSGFYSGITSQIASRGEPTGVSTGFRELDAITSGLQPSDLIILGARPSMGKTSLAMNIAQAVSMRQHKNTAVFSLEMSKEQLIHRIVCSEARIKSQDIKQGRVSDSDWTRIVNATNRLHQSPLFIDDTPAATTFDMRAKARRLVAEKGPLDLIVVDYLQLAHTMQMHSNRVVEISEIARSLKEMAREFKCPLIALSQLSRAVEQREDKRPMLSDLRESGSIEADADIVAFIYRASYYKRKQMMNDGRVDPRSEPDPDEGKAEIIIAKHRNGRVGAIELGFEPDFASFN